MEIEIGCSTLCFLLTKNLRDGLKEFKKNNIHAVELVDEYPIRLNKRRVEIIKSFDFEYSVHCPFVHLMLPHPDKMIRRFYLKLIEKSLKFAKEIHASEYVLHGGVIPKIYLEQEGGKPRIYFLDLWIKEVAPLLENLGNIKILVENLSPKEVFGFSEDFDYIKEKIRNIELCFDVAHAIVFNTFEKWIEKDFSYIHLSDNNLKDDEHLAIGEGKIDFENILRRILEKSENKRIKIILEVRSFNGCLKSIEALEKIIEKIKNR
ncbi:MAG: sugar phosphate isomerase/epimerase family protein [Candidatus Aenigmatarchaeota archaeon]